MRRLAFLLCMLFALPMLSAGLVVLVLLLQMVVGVDTAKVVHVPCARRALRCAATAGAVMARIVVVFEVALTQAAEAADAAAIVAGTGVNLVAIVVRIGGLCAACTSSSLSSHTGRISTGMVVNDARTSPEV